MREYAEYVDKNNNLNALVSTSQQNSREKCFFLNYAENVKKLSASK